MDAAPILSHFARIGFRISSRMAASAVETLVAGKAGRIKFCANRDLTIAVGTINTCNRLAISMRAVPVSTRRGAPRHPDSALRGGHSRRCPRFFRPARRSLSAVFC
jgi:hypothetical protein